jgi:magnesium-transporting ATPase (P-type)
MKIYSIQEYRAIEEQIRLAESKIDRDSALEIIYDRVDRGFILLGCTAVEDKLQESVPETIMDFLKASIKVWMLTGDKLETAENIGLSCGLIQENFEKITLSSEDDPISSFDRILAQIKAAKAHPTKNKVCLLMEGVVVSKILNNKKFKPKYIHKILKRCDSVICCRVSPREKAEVVKAIKTDLNKRTLAIGDGANDVNMIQQADIGIGMHGNEGLRAVQASDYAVPDFKSLWKLLMVHGRWSYIRNSELILYFFYKNMIFSVPKIIFCFYNGFSG